MGLKSLKLELIVWGLERVHYTITIDAQLKGKFVIPVLKKIQYF